MSADIQSYILNAPTLPASHGRWQYVEIPQRWVVLQNMTYLVLDFWNDVVAREIAARKEKSQEKVKCAISIKSCLPTWQVARLCSRGSIKASAWSADLVQELAFSYYTEFVMLDTNVLNSCNHSFSFISSLSCLCLSSAFSYSPSRSSSSALRRKEASPL